jgi:hypothetical protein
MSTIAIVGNPTGTPAGDFPTERAFEERDGFDLIWRQEYLQNQITEIENSFRAI